MKVIIAGSRNIKLSIEDLNAAIIDNDFYFPELEIVSGCATGPDTTAIKWADKNYFPCHKFPADWEKYGKSAGIIRNKQMGDFADELLAFWDGKSRGTKHMIDYMKTLNKPVKVIELGKTTL